MNLRITAVGALAAAVALVGCGDDNPDRPRGEIGIVYRTPDGQQLTDREAQYDFGSAFSSQTVEEKLVIWNRDRGTLNITAIEKVEGAAVQIGESGEPDPVWTIDFNGEFVVGPGERVEVPMTFHPPETQETVAYTATLIIRATNTRPGEDTATVTLTGKGIPGVCKLPNRIDFGAVAQHDVDEQRFTVSNPTAFPADVEIGEIYSSSGDDAAFSFAPGSAMGLVTVDPESSTEVIIEFRPTEAKTYLAFLKARASAGCPEQIIELTGAGVDQVLTWTPAQLDCGYVTPGIEVVREVTFTNAGNRDVEISQITTGNNPNPEFYVVAESGQDPTRLSIGGRGTATLQIACKPAVLGPRQGALKFNTSLPKQPSGQITLKAFGGGPDIEVSPFPNLNFGKVAYFDGVNPPVFQERKVVLRNAGTGPASPDPKAHLYLGQPDGMGGYNEPYVEVTPLNGATAPGEFTVSLPTYDPSVGLKPGIFESVTELVVRMTPASTGLKQAEIKIYSNDPDEPVVTLVATADSVVVPPCNFTVSPTTLNYGLIEPPSFRDLAFNITNHGTAVGDICLINGVSLSSTSHEFFSLPNGPIDSYELQPGETLQVIARVHATGQSPTGVSNISGAVDFFVSSPNRPSVQVQLVAQLAPSCLTIAPNALEYGTVKVGCASETKTFSIYNTCSSQVKLHGFSMQAAAGQPAGGPDCQGPQDCPEFFLMSSPPIPSGGLAVSPGGSSPLTFQVKYKPIDIGADTGAVAISAEQNGTMVTYVVPLSGKGDSIGIQTDVYTQDAKPKADILLVIDDSGSMGPYQDELAANFASFIKYAKSAAVDYHIAVITTEVGTAEYAKFRSGPGHEEKVLTPTTPKVEEKFKLKVNVGTSGFDEREAEPALMALTPPLINSENAGFLRNDAALAVVAVTDEMDHSPEPASYYLNGFWNIKGFNRKAMFTFNAIAGFTSPSPCAVGSIDDGMLATLVTQSNGVKEDICTPDWAKTLENLGKTAFGFRTNFFLIAQPDLTQGPIEVRIDNKVQDPVDDRGATIWTYDSVANSVNFEPLYVPEPGQTLTITYHTTCYQ